MKKILIASLFALSGAVSAEPAVVFDCKDDAKTPCVVSIDRERIAKALQPAEQQLQSAQSPSEAMNAMANVMNVFAALLASK